MAAVVIGATLGLGSWGLLVVLRHSLRSGVTASTRLEARSVAELLHEDGVVSHLPAPVNGTVIQVLRMATSKRRAGDSQVVLASSGISRKVSLVGGSGLWRIEREAGFECAGWNGPCRQVGKPREVLASIRLPRQIDPDRDSTLLVVDPTTLAGSPGDPRSSSGIEPASGGSVLVLAAAPLGTVTADTRTTRDALLIGVVVLVLLGGGMAWILTGRALDPVEAVRSEVSMLSTSDLERRVTVPSTRDEIQRLAETMNEMLDRLADGAARQQRLVGDASHELRTPVAVIRAHLEVALSHWDAPGAREGVRAAWEEGLAMQRIVDDLLVLARADAGVLALRHQDVDVDEIAIDEAARLRSQGRVEVDSTGISAARITGDYHLVQRAIRNLVDNAERYARSTIRITTRLVPGSGHAQRSSAEVAVWDDGPGVAAEDRDRIFERFGQSSAPGSQGLARSGQGNAGGAGLGLAIAREIAVSHGGDLVLEDRDERSVRWTVFVLRFPVGGWRG